jgi:cytochrome c556
MNDQFLHRLRSEPRAEFVTRLKWQLDRPVQTRPRAGRWILGLAIFGTAFALVSPPARQAIHGLFTNTLNNVPTNDTTRPASPGVVGSSVTAAGKANPPRSNVRPAQFEPALPLSRSPELAGTPLPADSQADVKLNAALGDSVMPFSITGRVGGLTPQMQADRAVLLRQGLFRVMGWVMPRLNAAQHADAPVDMKVIAADAVRLQQLTSLIPEVFQQDTRALDTNTRALSIIWNEPLDFRSKVDDLALAADSLARAAASSDEVATGKAISRIENACTACHRVYRGN